MAEKTIIESPADDSDELDKPVSLCGVKGCEELARYVETGDGHAVRNPKRRCAGHYSGTGLWRDLVVSAKKLHRSESD